MIRSIVVGIASLWLGGCADVAYYAQAIEGESQVLAAAHPIRDVIADPATDATLRRQLEQARAIREFASRELALPDNGSYRSYATLSRPYVVWNVFAAPEFSLEARQWCMLFVGCVGYRGYFSERAAEAFAERLKRQGYDTFVGGVSAYSTLGYFDDPVLDTFLRLGDQRVAHVIFHELAHELVFVRGDTAFNESFAVTVEEEGMRRWLKQSGDPGQLREFAAQEARKVEFHALLADCRERLRSIYASALPRADKLRDKAQAYADLRLSYAKLKSRWNGYSGYDPWFAQPLDNALLASVALYTKRVPSFQALLAQEHGDLPSFYRRVAALARLPQSTRTATLDRLAAGRLPALSSDTTAPPERLPSGSR